MTPMRKPLRQRVLDYLTQHHLVTVLAESEEGDHHEVYAPTWPAVLGNKDGIVELLTQLEREGLVERHERVHPFDTSEYFISWRGVIAERHSSGTNRNSTPKRNGVAARSATSGPGNGRCP
jgi:hypothetical protein